KEPAHRTVRGGHAGGVRVLRRPRCAHPHGAPVRRGPAWRRGGAGGRGRGVRAALWRPWTGRIGATRGRRVLAVSGATVVGVSILLYGVATQLWMLVLARLLTGAGEAAMFVGVATAAQDLAPDHRRGEAASYFSVALYGGLAVGPPRGELAVSA